jgi:hypothetical protein
MPGADRCHELGEWDPERVRDAVQGSNPRGDSAGLDLDQGLAVHPCCLGEVVQRAPALVAETRDLDAEGAEVWGWDGHASTLPQLRLMHSNLNAPVFGSVDL